MTSTIVVMLAGLMGAAGVVLAALSAHAVSDASLQSAAQILSLHAAALLGGAAVLNCGLLWRPLGAAALFGIALGASLFSSDVALRVLAGSRLFPMAAPAGGTIMIVSWLALAGAGLRGLLRSL